MFLALKNPFQGYTEFCAKTRLQSVQTGKFRISVTEGSQVKGRGMARSKAKNEKMEKKPVLYFMSNIVHHIVKQKSTFGKITLFGLMR